MAGGVRRRLSAATAVAAVAGALGPAGVLATAASPPPAYADRPVAESVSMGTRYRVTLVARVCAEYFQVMAGRVVDDEAETAQAPGRDSGYAAGQPVDPDTEARNGAGCEPLPGWRFTLGSGQQRQGALSSVTGVVGEAGPTGDGVLRLDSAGQSAGSGAWSAGQGSSGGQGLSGGRGSSGGQAEIAGAVTVTLDDDQVKLALRRELWVQGGRPNDPLLGHADLAFGALRCGTGSRSGANAAWIGFPSEVRHVFCYAYYVRDPAATGTVVVRARLTRPVGYPQRLQFTTSFGYAPSGSFTLATAGPAVEASFRRTAGGPYRVATQLPAGWALADLTCTASRGSAPGTGTASIEVAGGRADITLAAGETTTCSYLVDPPEVPPGLTVRVAGDGGGAAFGITVAGTGRSWPMTAVLPGDGSAVATGADLSAIDPGTYTLTVTPPDGGDAWRLAGASCAGADLEPSGLTVTAPVSAGVPVECVLRMARPTGLRLRVVTTGGTASAGFVVERDGEADVLVVERNTLAGATAPDSGAESAAGWSAVATTAGSGQAADAELSGAARLAAGSYLVTPLAPLATTDGGWTLTGFDCEPDGAAEATTAGVGPDGGPSPGALRVTLTAGGPAPVCTARYGFRHATRFQVVLRSEGSPVGRQDAAVAEVRCADGSSGRAVLGGEEYGEQELPRPLSFLSPTRCLVTHPETGVSRWGNVSTTAVLDPAPGDAPLTLPATVDVRRDVAEYTVTVTDTFDAIVSRSKPGLIANPFRTLPAILVGSGLVGAGVLVLLIVVARWRRSPDAAE